MKHTHVPRRLCFSSMFPEFLNSKYIVCTSSERLRHLLCEKLKLMFYSQKGSQTTISTILEYCNNLLITFDNNLKIVMNMIITIKQICRIWQTSGCCRLKRQNLKPLLNLCQWFQVFCWMFRLGGPSKCIFRKTWAFGPTSGPTPPPRKLGRQKKKKI